MLSKGNLRKAVHIYALIAAIQMATSFSHADNSVGDAVTYVGLQNGSPFILESQITAKAPNGQWVVHTTQHYLGSKTESEEITTVISQKSLNNILQSCESLGATPEEITVKAGNFKSCKFSNPGSPTAWVGDVPFGLIKEENHEPGLDVFAELSSFKRINP